MASRGADRFSPRDIGDAVECEEVEADEASTPLRSTAPFPRLSAICWLTPLEKEEEEEDEAEEEEEDNFFGGKALKRLEP